MLCRIFLCFAFPVAFAAQEVAQTFTLDGQLFSDTPGTIPLIDAATVLRIQILNPGETCILYEETQTVSTLASDGRFTVKVGSAPAAVKRGANDSNHAMAAVFSNSAASIAGRLVSNGAACSYIPTAADSRYVRMQVTPSSDGLTRTLTPNMNMDSVPTAIVAESAETIQGLAPASLLQVDTTAPAVLSQANLESIFSTTNFPRLTTLLSVAPANYIQTGSNGSVAIPAVAGNPGTPAAGQFWYDSVSNTMKYHNGTSVFTVGNTTSVSGTAIQAGTIGGSTAVNTTGNIQTANDITSERLFLYDNSGAGPGFVGFRAPTDIAGSGGTSYTLTWPNTAGTSNQVLTTDGSGTLTWATPASATPAADSLDFTEFKDALALDASTDIAVSGTNEFSVTNSGTGNSLIVNDQAADTTPFIINAAGSVGIGTTAPANKLHIQTNVVNDGMTFESNLNNNESVNINFLRSRGTASAKTTLQNGDEIWNFVGHGYTPGGSYGWSSALVSSVDAAPAGANTPGNFRFYTNNGSSWGERVRISSGGNVGVGTNSPGTILDVAGAITSRPFGTATGQTGQIVMRELAAGGTNTFTIKAPDALTTERSWVLPDANGTNGQALITDGSGNLSWSTVSSGVPAADSLDFTEFADALALDASTDISITGANVLSVSNTGTGNSFVVNDEAGDTTPFVIDASGKVGISTTTPTTALQVDTIGARSGVLVKSSSGTGIALDGSWPTVNFNSYHDGTNKIAVNAQYSANISVDPAVGTMYFNTGNNPGAGATVTETTQMTLLRTGKFGIGEAAPSAALTVKTSTQFDGFTLNNATNPVARIYGSTAANDSGVFSLSNGGTTIVQFSAGNGINSYINYGSLGIGTSAPGTTLDVAGAVTSRPSGTGAGQTGQIVMRELAAGGTNTFTLKAPDALTTDRAWILPDSNGTTGQFLSTDGSGNLSWATASGGAPSADSLDFTEFADALTLDASTTISATGANVLSITNSGTGDSFVVNDQASDTTPFLIDASGNVGIGTPTPSAALDIAGQIRSIPYDAGTSMAINWHNGNNQYTAPAGATCGAIALTNLLDGGSYTLVVQNVTSGTCTFSQSGLTFVYSPSNAAVTSDAVYTFLRVGTKVYVSWVTGFN